MKIDINKKQRKIIGIFIIALVFIIIIWFFIYLPQRNKLNLIIDDLKNTEDQISQIKALGSGKSLEVAVQDLTRKLDSLKSNFIGSEREIINTLSNEATKLKIIVKSITPHQKLDYNIDSEIKGYVYQELPITMKLTTEFKNLGEYLNFLENDLNALVIVKKLDINGQGEGVFNLDVSLNLTAYLLAEK